MLAIRRLPYTVRGSFASLLLVHRSIEEAAASVGATGLRTFRDVTLPLIWRGVLVGALFSFMTSLQEASAVLFLSLGGWETITVGIFAFYIAGSANEAAALGVILIVVAAVSVAHHQPHGRHPHGRHVRLDPIRAKIDAPAPRRSRVDACLPLMPARRCPPEARPSSRERTFAESEFVLD